MELEERIFYRITNNHWRDAYSKLGEPMGECQLGTLGSLLRVSENSLSHKQRDTPNAARLSMKLVKWDRLRGYTVEQCSRIRWRTTHYPGGGSLMYRNELSIDTAQLSM